MNENVQGSSAGPEPHGGHTGEHVMPHLNPVKRVERVVLDPGDDVLCGLKRRFEAGQLHWQLYCMLWSLRKRRLRRRLNAGTKASTGTSFRTLLNPKEIPAHSIPVVINNYNRLDSLRIQVEWLQSLNAPVWIVILDNASSFPPLLEYYAKLDPDKAHVIRLGYNSGFEGLQDAARCLRRCPYFVITDPDLIPYPDTPKDILDRMRAALRALPEVHMVGASLEIDDIPPFYPLRDKVQKWEARFWPPLAKRIGDWGFDAWVDTTFAMYRQGGDVLQIEPAMRLDRPYVLKHVDWYTHPAHLTDEQKHYAARSQPIASWTSRLNTPV